MENKFKKCLKNRKIIKFSNAKNLIKKEIETAKEDLKEAKNRFKAKKFKYATVNAYYSLFHAARALLYQRGLRERSHLCLRIAIDELYVKKKLLEPGLLEVFDDAMGLREDADYEGTFSKIGAKQAVKGAEKFLKATLEILAITNP